MAIIFLNQMKNYKPTNPKSPTNTKQRNNEKLHQGMSLSNCSKAVMKNILKGDEEKDMLHIQRNIDKNDIRFLAKNNAGEKS